MALDNDNICNCSDQLILNCTNQFIKNRTAVLEDSFSFYGPAYSFSQPIATKYQKNNDTFYQSKALL